MSYASPHHEPCCAAQRYATDWPLVLTGSAPFLIWLVNEFTIATTPTRTPDGKPAPTEYPTRYLALLSIVGCIIGIALLPSRRAKKKIPRGWDCCCSCPFPIWFNAIQMIGIPWIGLMWWYSETQVEAGYVEEEVAEQGALNLKFAVMTAVACVAEMTFGFLWLHWLYKQDQDVCCGISVMVPMPTVMPPGGQVPVTSHGAVGTEFVVVGRPVGVQQPQDQEVQKNPQGGEGGATQTAVAVPVTTAGGIATATAVTAVPAGNPDMATAAPSPAGAACQP
eukprot:TRINITY_DN104978_c0_g1_i1.p1 TRINITY_DN104978_c0_g1~~TRINITY_DN104978_c0_g1_i1.p1  ORF type:complete len:279 (-),score=29.87 TRINITY_DN104978_c0_g1_i1:148-984(-)